MKTVHPLDADLAIQGKDLHGKLVRIRPLALAAKYRTEEFLTVEVLGGNGARPDAIGSSVFVQFSDGDESVFGRGQIERLATQAEILAYQTYRK